MKTNRPLAKTGLIMTLLALASFGSPARLSAAEVAMSWQITRDGSSEFVEQDWIGINHARRWTYKYSSSGAAPALNFDFQYKDERSVRDEETDTWGAWSVTESGSATATSVNGAAAPPYPLPQPSPFAAGYVSPQSVSHYFTDYDGTTRSNSYEMSEGHCPGMTLFGREKADYGDKLAAPIWFIAYTASISDKYLYVAPGAWYVSPSAPLGMAWQYRWPTDADLQITSTEGHGWTDYVTWSPEISYSGWAVPIQGVVWLFDYPSFTSVTLNQSGFPPGVGGFQSVTCTAPVGTKPYYRTYTPAFTATLYSNQ
jgi:hypothetical protein